MLSYGLLVISIAVVVIAYFILLINKFNSKKKLDNFCGFDAAKEVTSNYDSINVVMVKHFCNTWYGYFKNHFVPQMELILHCEYVV